MYFNINNGKINICTLETWKNCDEGVAVCKSSDLKNELDLDLGHKIPPLNDGIHFCKLERYVDYMFGTMHIPKNTNHNKDIRFYFYIFTGKIIFIDDTKTVEPIICDMADEKARKVYTLERFFYDFLSSFIDDDLIYLESLQSRISKIEENILNGSLDNFNTHMVPIKKDILRLHRYYGQLADIGVKLIDSMDNECDFFKEDLKTRFELFKERALRLQSEVELLRQYSMEVQSTYQSEIGIKQNDIMKTLTIVTTIFLPLTLIAGWYGMNFINMPELKWRYGYPFVILVSISIIAFILWIFKKKKFF